MVENIFLVTACAALLIVSVAFVLTVERYETELHEFKYEAYKRGYMVQCRGRDSYHWECARSTAAIVLAQSGDARYQNG